MRSILEGTLAPPVSAGEISVSDRNILDTEDEHDAYFNHDESDQVASGLDQAGPVAVGE